MTENEWYDTFRAGNDVAEAHLTAYLEWAHGKGMTLTWIDTAGQFNNDMVRATPAYVYDADYAKDDKDWIIETPGENGLWLAGPHSYLVRSLASNFFSLTAKDATNA